MYGKRIYLYTLTFKTHGPGFVDLAKKIAFEIQSQNIGKTAALKLKAEMVKAHA